MDTGLFSALNTNRETLAYVFCALVLVSFYALVWYIRGRRHRKDPYDATFLDHMQSKLSPDEMRRVRESFLRKVEEEENRRKNPVTIKELQHLAKMRALGGIPGAPAPASPPDATQNARAPKNAPPSVPAPAEPSARPTTQDASASPEMSPTTSPEPPAATAPPGAMVDIDVLLKKGLITETEYHRIRNHLRSS